MLRVILWIAATLVVAIGAIAIGNEGIDETDVRSACTGHAASRQLEHTLFTARALSFSGADPICTPPDNDDDVDGVMLSHSPRFRLEGTLARRRL